MRTFSVKSSEIKKDWILIDAEGLVLGRLSAIVASRLRGKHKATFTPHMDNGDNVIVINADKIKVTGNKLDDSRFYWHTGYPGGIKSRSVREILNSKFPERVLLKAVERMLPKGPLGRKMLGNLKAYAGAEHPHTAQQPTVLDIASMNKKNVREK